MIAWAHYEYMLNIISMDMRKGLPSLIHIARFEMGWDVSSGQHIAMFTSRNSKVMKLVGKDKTGYFLVMKRLSKGGFQRIRALSSDSTVKELPLTAVMDFWDGKDIQVLRASKD